MASKEGDSEALELARLGTPWWTQRPVIDKSLVRTFCLVMG